MEWTTRIDHEHRAGNLTRSERDVLRALGRLLAFGDHAPSEARIANEAAVSVRSVSRAKARARELGLLAWERRRTSVGRLWDDCGKSVGKRGNTAGLRRELPCSYRAETPARAVVRRERQRGRVSGQEGRMLRSVEAQLAALGPITPAMEVLWAARRARLYGGDRREAAS